MAPTQTKASRAPNRRSSHRYAVDAEVQYKVLSGRTTLTSGHGRTINISSSGILFTAAEALPRGNTIELSIAWPARLDGRTPMQLRVRGSLTRVHGNCAAVRIQQYEFHTRGVHGRIGAA
ncbi:MAG TPA: PilZ domain-containing protein [Bryobacteraceae bacterium]|jgi:hypothetical protein